jgi:hypothetical protein
VKLAEVVVTAVSGIAASGAITDFRTRVNNSARKIVAKSGAYTIDFDDSVILCSGTFSLTLPSAALVLRLHQRRRQAIYHQEHQLGHDHACWNHRQHCQ